MYRINPAIKKNQEIEKHLNNGFKFALLINGQIIVVKRYQWELDIQRKANRLARVVPLISLLIEI